MSAFECCGTQVGFFLDFLIKQTIINGGCLKTASLITPIKKFDYSDYID